MKAEDIRVGGHYSARVNGNLTTVRVDQIMTNRGAKGNQTYYKVTNLKSGRQVMFRSAAKFRAEVEPEQMSVQEAGNIAIGAMIEQGTLSPMVPTEVVKILTEAHKKEDEKRPDPPSTIPALSAATTTVKVSALPLPISTTLKTNGLASLLRKEQTISHAKVDTDAPHLMIEARAGTGKTTTLVEGLKIIFGYGTQMKPSEQQAAVWDEMAKSTGKVRTSCFAAFNWSIANELKRRVPRECPAKTMHGLGIYCLRKNFQLLPNDGAVNGNRTANHLAEILGVNLRQFRKDKPTVVKAATELVGKCKQNLVAMSPEGHADTQALELKRLSKHYGIDQPDSQMDRELVWDLVPKLLERAKDVSRDRYIDFNDMIWIPVVLSLPIFVNDLLLVDEAQDLNRCQQALAKRISRRMVLCGDPKQSIYGFAGADPESMPRLQRELSETDRGCTHLPLTFTRRCGKAIVEEARRIVPDFHYFESNPEGVVGEALYPIQHKSEGGRLVEYEIKEEDSYLAKVCDDDMILCRTNAPLVNQCMRFLKKSRRAFIQGRDIAKGLVDLIESFAAKDVPELIQVLSDWYMLEIAKENAEANPSEARTQRISDQYGCIKAFTDGKKDVGEVIGHIHRIFSEGKECPKCRWQPSEKEATECDTCCTQLVPIKGIRLSSIHKAKGLEARRVFFLQPAVVPMRPRDKMKAWEKVEADNLEYVGITRAIEEMTYVR